MSCTWQRFGWELKYPVAGQSTFVRYAFFGSGGDAPTAPVG